jgi:hypothetical protein
MSNLSGACVAPVKECDLSVSVSSSSTQKSCLQRSFPVENGALLPSESKTRWIKDVLYDFVELRAKEKSVVDTPHFQALRRVDQLGPVPYLYPSAGIKRFEHSLGVPHLSLKMLETLRSNQPELEVTDFLIESVRLASLCHDIGHIVSVHADAKREKL